MPDHDDADPVSRRDATRPDAAKGPEGDADPRESEPDVISDPGVEGGVDAPNEAPEDGDDAA